MYVNSRLRVIGSDLSSFLETLIKPNAFNWPTLFSLHQTVPSQNPELLAEVERLPNLDLWGTAWDVIEPRVWTQTHSEFEVSFKTFRSVPDKWLERVAELYPDLSWDLSTDLGNWRVSGSQHIRDLLILSRPQ